MKTGLLVFLAFLSFSANALVDYTDAVANPTPEKGKVAPKAPASPSASLQKSISLTAGRETLTVPYENLRNKASLYSVNANFQTPYSLFLAASYWMAQSDSTKLATKKGLQAGNPYMKLGFNWLTFGSSQDLATFDIYAALMFPGAKGSEFASSRLDKMVGVELTKLFYDFALQLGYEYRIAGTVKREGEVGIGNIQKITTSLGWRVSSDIRLALEGAMLSIAQKADSPLTESTKFAYLSPKLSLGITNTLDLELGALYQTRKAPLSSNLFKARLWDLKGLYGNSLFANLALAF